VAQKLSDKVRDFLEQPRYAVLGTINEDGSVQQTVMWYELRGDHVMMNTKRGRVKDNNLLRDRRISLCVEDEYRYVTLSGEATLIEDQAAAQADIKTLAIRYHGQEKGEKQSRDLFAKQQRITILLPIERVIADGFEDE
jgi:PPOX class probable F420-dependent enzyme